MRDPKDLMWAQACEAMERADRLHRQFFHRSHTTPCWEAPVDIFETDEALPILIAVTGQALATTHPMVPTLYSAGIIGIFTALAVGFLAEQRVAGRQLENA